MKLVKGIVTEKPVVNGHILLLRHCLLYHAYAQAQPYLSSWGFMAVVVRVCREVE